MSLLEWGTKCNDFRPYSKDFVTNLNIENRILTKSGVDKIEE